MPSQLSLDLCPPPAPPAPTTHIEVLCGLTPWALTADRAPPWRGWWITLDTRQFRARRWWDGKSWSIATTAMEDHEMEQLKEAKYRGSSRSIYWCGLARPHPAGYFEYQLMASPELEFLNALRTAGAGHASN